MSGYLRAYWAFVVVPLVAVLGLVVVPAQVILWRQGQAAEDAARVAPATSEVQKMADGWLVEGAGEADANGIYELAGTHNGADYFTNGNGWYLWNGFPPEMGMTEWCIGPTLGENAAYTGDFDAALPANPWRVGSGTAPAPTVFEYTAPADVDPVLLLRNVPRDMSVARMEWVEVSGADYLYVLGRAQATNEPHLDRYDPATNSWSLSITTIPAAVRDAAAFDTCVYDGKLYVGLRQPPGYSWALWEYDPGADAWAERAAFAEHGDLVFSGSVFRLVCNSNGATLHFVYRATSATAGDYEPALRTVDASTWAVAGGGRYEYSTAAFVDACDSLGSVMGVQFWFANGDTTRKPGGIVVSGTPGHNTIVGSWVPDLSTYYAFNALTGQSWRMQVTRGTLTTSHDISGVLCAAGLDDDLYVLAKPDGQAAALYLLDTRPRATSLTAVVDGSAVTVGWTFDDPDLSADEQSAWQVVITDEAGATVDDSTKLTTDVSEYEATGLANGSYIATVTVWDRDGQASPAATKTFNVGGAGAGDDPPTVSITAPAPAATITGDATVTATATDDNAVADVRFYVDGDLIATLTVPTDAEEDEYSTTWAVSGYGAGSHTITAVARDNAGQTASASVTVTLDTSGDTTAPTVTITSPAAAATVSGEVAVTATATDDVAVVRVRLYVDGQLQDTVTAPTSGSSYSLAWDSAGWANGAHTLRVTATDAAGNIGVAERSVTLDRSKALSTLYLFLKQQPQAELADRWRSGLMIEEVVCAAIPREAVPADEHERYQVYAGIHVPGTSVNFDDYQLVRTNRVNTLLTPGPSFRFALKAVPSLTVAYWELDATAPLRLIDVPGEPGPMVLTEGDPGLWQLGAGGYTLAAAVDMTSPVDAAYLDGQILVAGDELHVVDLDTGDLTWEARLPAATGYTALGAPPSAVGGTSALVGVETATGDLLYSFAYASLRQVAEVDAEIARIVYDATGQVAGIGLADGTVQRWAAGGTSLTEIMDTGAAVASALLDLSGGVVYAGTGTDGEVWYKNAGGDVSLDATLAAGTVRAMARWNSRLYATGLGDGALWRREGDVAGWAQWYLFDDVTDISDLYVDAASRLWVAATHTGGTRIYRLEAESGGDFECGDLIPDLYCGVVKATVATV